MFPFLLLILGGRKEGGGHIGHVLQLRNKRVTSGFTKKRFHKETKRNSL